MSTGRGDLADDEPAPTGKAGPAKASTATDAMRLRGRRRAPETPAAEEAPTDAGARALEELLELHSSGLVRLCRECLTPHPCRSRQLAEVIAGTPAPPEEGSQ